MHKSGYWEHEYWKQKVGEQYRRKGYEVTFEYKIGDGKSVDLVADKDCKRIAIEIETGKSDSIYNIRKDLEAGFDEIVILILDEKLRSIIEQNITAKEKVRILDTRDFS